MQVPSMIKYFIEPDPFVELDYIHKDLDGLNDAAISESFIPEARVRVLETYLNKNAHNA